MEQKEIVEELQKEDKLSRQWISELDWRCATFHSTLETNEPGTLYRRDIRCANGDILLIEGKVEKLINRKTGKSLYPEMDSVIRRIINSIKPLDE